MIKLSDKKEFTAFLDKYLSTEYGKSIGTANANEMHYALSKLLVAELEKNWSKTTAENAVKKQACYFSAEYLMGRAIHNNLLNMGLTDEIFGILKENGFDVSALEDVEDAALGNGGLGRLAACFIESAATHKIPLYGYGIRYKYGIFKQKFENGFQKEELDDWTKHGDPWSVRRDDETVTVEFGDGVVKAVPYDMPIIGYGGEYITTLRLWQAEALTEFDFDKFNEQDYIASLAEKNSAENISRILYPNDSTDEGKALRIKQQYFFCSASLQSIINNYIKVHGDNLSALSEYFAIQLNDTHPTVAIPELIRILVDEHKFTFEKAFKTARKIFAYTNHTVMSEALEKWNTKLFSRVLPRVYHYIERISARLETEFTKKGGKYKKNLRLYRIIKSRTIHMANLAIYGSNCVNGVAELHTEILKKDVLKAWYAIFPGRFQNKTNGITQRRWLALCNPELTSMIAGLLGSDRFITELDELKPLEKFVNDKKVLDDFIVVKNTKKEQLSKYIEQQEGIKIPPNFIFSIQIKRLHEYKRQFLNALSILYIYYGLKDGSIKNFNPTAFIFGAKSAPGYFRAKAVIKLINEIAEKVNNDKDVNDKLMVVFVHNYNVSYAEKLIPAADFSEQISTAGTEASGTGNMKFMLNGTVTLGTYDGANVEIVEEAGEENNYIFGARVEDIERIKETYNPNTIIAKNPRLKKIMKLLISSKLDDSGTGMFEELYNAITKGASWHKPDHYYLCLDFKDYVETKLRAINEYSDKYAFAKKCLMNTANAGKFSSDRTIKQYAAEIWKVIK